MIINSDAIRCSNARQAPNAQWDDAEEFFNPLHLQLEYDDDGDG